MNKRDLEKLIKIEEELRDASLKLFLISTRISTKTDDLRKLLRKYKEKAAK